MSYQDFNLQTLINLKNTLKAEMKSLSKSAEGVVEADMRNQVRFIFTRLNEINAELLVRKICRGSDIQGDLFENQQDKAKK
jgi:hypothetical protein